MNKGEARAIARELKWICIDRCGKCGGDKRGCKVQEQCQHFLGENAKPQYYDLVNIIDHIEKNF